MRYRHRGLSRTSGTEPERHTDDLHVPPACPNILSDRDDRVGTSFCNWTSGTGRAAPLSKVDVSKYKDTGFTLLTGGELPITGCL